MKNKRNWYGMLVIILVFGMTAVGCDDGTNSTKILDGMVNITGTTTVGQTLTANTSSLGGNGNITYQWKRGNIYIGTNSNNYIVQSDDVGSRITVTVTRDGYSGSVSSNPTGIIGFPVLTGNIYISGTPTVGQTLTVYTSSLGGSGNITYQWKRGNIDIGTNSSNYVVELEDVGSRITVTVTRDGYSGSASSLTEIIKLSAPNGVILANISPGGGTPNNNWGGSITISWNSVQGATGYNIYQRPDEFRAYYKIGTTTSTSLTYSGSYYPGEKYQFSVSAYYENTEGFSSVVVSTTIPGTHSLLNPPTSITANAISRDSITVSWNSVSGATGYQIYRSTSSSGPYSYAYGVYAPSTSFTNTGLTANTTYYYKVAAQNNTIGTPYLSSSTASARTLSGW